MGEHAPDGEIARIERIAQIAATAGGRLVRATGDDAAVVRADGAIVTSVDASVDGVHFERGVFAAPETGYKAAARAMSDIAAMGVAAGELYVAIGVPGDVDATEFDAIAAGVAAASDEHGFLLAGGDLSASPVLWLAATVTGHCDDPGQAVGRDGAQPGDVLCVTGQLGGAAAGLPLLRDPRLAARAGIDAAVATALRERQTRPQPRLAAGQALAAAGAHALIDLSDGIAKDATAVADASGVRLEIELERLPLQDGVTAIAAELGRDPLELAVAGGEDFELLAALPAAAAVAAREAMAASGLGLREIGKVTAGSGLALLRGDGSELSVAGYEHFS